MWYTLESAGPDELTSRRLPAVASLSKTKIAIFGGISGKKMQSDVFIVDIVKKSTEEKVLEDQEDRRMSFYTRSGAI